MLARTLGPGKAQVQVNSDLNVDKTTLNKLEYAKRGTPAEGDRGDRAPARRRRRGRGRRGGHRREHPELRPGRRRRRRLELPARVRDRRTSASTRPCRRPRSPPGTVEKLNVALMVDKTVPAATFAQLQKTVQAAAGVDTAARRRLPGRAARVRQAGRAEGRPGADGAARAAEVGRPRPRDPALPLLHDPPPAQARERDHRRAGVADADRGARLAGGRSSPATACRPSPRRSTCCPRAHRTPTSTASTS